MVVVYGISWTGMTSVWVELGVSRHIHGCTKETLILVLDEETTDDCMVE